MKVLKDYGAAISRGSKELRLQIIQNANKEKRLALVSYKDGMSTRVTDITDETKELKRLLEDYLDYRVEKKPKDNVIPFSDVVKTLTSLPANDTNYHSTLKKATREEIELAIKTMKASDGKHATRIKYCESELAVKHRETKENKTSTIPPKPTEKKDDKKVITFPTEDKKPKTIPLKSNGEHTYEECVAKLDKEAEMFKDPDSQYVIEGLKELCKVDADFRNNVMQEDKTYGGFMEYMYKAAQNGYCVKYGNVGWIDRDTGLGLAIDYYNADIKKMEAEEEKKRKEEAAKRKAEADKKKKEASKNGKKKTTTRKKKGTA